MTTLQILWFFLIGMLLIGYTILDGFDLGAGIWHLLRRNGRDRQALRRAIGPFWDANEVWLLTAGGALFAAFPQAYATVFSGFYLPLIVVLLGLIFRATALEFLGKHESPRWRAAWGLAFGLGSLVPGLLFGVALGNILRGVPLNDQWNYTGSFFTLLNPFALLVGLLGLAMLALHGALYMAWRGGGETAENARGWANAAWWTFAVLYTGTAIAALAGQAHLAANYRRAPILWGLPLVTAACFAMVWACNRLRRARAAFLFSALGIAGLWGIVGAALFPRLVPALGGRGIDLTIANASSSELTLKVMLIVAAIGIPLVLVYTVWIYRLLGRGGTEGPREHSA